VRPASSGGTNPSAAALGLAPSSGFFASSSGFFASSVGFFLVSSGFLTAA